jgi:hypothetical protein
MSDRTAQTLNRHFRSTQSRDNVIFDLPIFLLAHAIRTGVFGPACTVENLWEIEQEEFQAAKEYLGLPVLCPSAARGFGLDYSACLKYPSALTTFKFFGGEAGFRGTSVATLAG